MLPPREREAEPFHRNVRPRLGDAQPLPASAPAVVPLPLPAGQQAAAVPPAPVPHSLRSALLEDAMRDWTQRQLVLQQHAPQLLQAVDATAIAARIEEAQEGIAELRDELRTLRVTCATLAHQNGLLAHAFITRLARGQAGSGLTTVGGAGGSGSEPCAMLLRYWQP